MRHRWLSLAFLVLAAPVFAQDPATPRPRDQARPTSPRFDIYLGFDSIHGVDQNPVYVVPRTSTLTVGFGWNVTPSVAFVVDEVRFGVNAGQTGGRHVDYSVLAGPRLRLGHSTRVLPYAEMLVGAVRTDVQQSPSATPLLQTMFQAEVAVGLDVPVKNWLVVRPVQFGVRHVFNGSSSDTTLSFRTGVVFRFGKRVGQ